MEFRDLKTNDNYLKEYIKLCSLEWGSKKTKEEMNNYIDEKLEQIKTSDKIIKVIGLFDKDNLIGFISLFKYDGEERNDLTPWYATMYVKKEYRGNNYSKLLNDEILKEAKKLNYKKVYLKSELVNYYEKFGAQYIQDLSNNEKLYYINLK